MSRLAQVNRDEAIAFNSKVIERFRAQGGSGPLGDDLPFNADALLLLTHTGVRSGLARTTPLGFLELDEERLFVVASFLGAPRDPDWYHNVATNSRVTVEIGARHFAAEAVVATEEYDALFTRAVELWPFLTEHRERAGRRLPLVELRPARDETV